MAAPRWADGLTVAGLYYDGVIGEKRLQDTLELHKRDTVSTFGTRSSRRVEKDKDHHGPNTVKPLITDSPRSGQPPYSGQIQCPRLILP